MIKKLKNPTMLNIIVNLILQFVTIISGFIIPKLILSNFGSEVNGLISSINQFLSYITLLEGGITGVIMTALYKPLVENDSNKISSIIKTSGNFFKKISIIFIAYTLVLSILYPIIFNVNFSFNYVFSLTWILSIGLFIQYMFSLNLKILLNADKKIYIVSFVQIIIVILNVIGTFIIVKFFTNVHILKIFNGILYLIQPVVYSYFIKKYYKIDKNVSIDDTLLKNRWNGFAINLAHFIHFSTDLTILTIFTNLEIVSIYSVFALVTTGLRQLLQSVTSSFSPVIGHSYAKGDLKELNKKMDLYEFVILYLVGILFTVALLLITPFVMIYTSDITDANYYQPVFGVLLVLSEVFYLLKFPHLHLAYAANKYKEVTPAAYIESFINIVLSIPLVICIGLPGVAIGTLIAMIFRLCFHVYFSSKLIEDRNTFLFLKKIIYLFIISFISIFVCKLFGSVDYNIFSWISYGILYTIVVTLFYFLFGFFYFKKEFKMLIDFFRK